VTSFLSADVRETPVDSEHGSPKQELTEKEQANPSKLPTPSSSTESLVLSLFLMAPRLSA